MKIQGLPDLAERPEQPPERRREWYGFLEEECRRDNGLLCFYDRPKSRKVAYLCGLLADCLFSAEERLRAERLSKLFDAGSGREESSTAPDQEFVQM